ncbi:MAG: sigma-70 family RNA polymerase sigma factor [Saprospiraceae bacterium]|nr:sigma-70 family RNA polymerase sigma factor [Saprospiraceae bacterium]
MLVNSTLIDACIGQDRAAQRQLYEELLPYLRAIANRYLRNPSWWKDALQESYVKIFRNISQYEHEKASFQHWAAKIVINTCLNYNQRNKGNSLVEFVLNLHDFPVDPSITQYYSDEFLLQILKCLPDGYFEVVNLHVIEGFSHQEIGQMLGIQEALSRQKLARARAWLINKLCSHPQLASDLPLTRFLQNSQQ